MKIKYTVSTDGLRIDAYSSGVLDIKDTMEYFREIEIDSNIYNGAIEVVHFDLVCDFNIYYS